MKLAVINSSGNASKTTAARHLLAPRIPGCAVVAVESINADVGQPMTIGGPAARMRLVFNQVEDNNPIEQVFETLLAYCKVSCTVLPRTAACMRSNEVYARIRGASLSLLDLAAISLLAGDDASSLAPATSVSARTADTAVRVISAPLSSRL